MMEDAVRASAGEVSDNGGGHAGSTGMSTQGVAVLMGQRFEEYGKEASQNPCKLYIRSKRIGSYPHDDRTASVTRMK